MRLVGRRGGQTPVRPFLLLSGLLLLSPVARIARADDVGLRLRIEAPSLSQDTRVLLVDEDRPAALTLRLQSTDSEPLPVALSLVTSWRTVSFSLEGVEAGLHRLNIPPGASAHRISWDRPVPGRYPAAILLFLLPDVHTDDPDFRQESREMLFAIRFLILSGEGTSLPPLLEDPTTEVFVEKYRTFLLTPESGRDPWHTCPAGEVRWRVKIGNPDDFAREFALLAFLDFRPIPLDPTRAVRLLRLPPATAATFDGSFVTREAGEFLLVLADEPFGDWRPGVTVHSTQRVRLTAR